MTVVEFLRNKLPIGVGFALMPWIEEAKEMEKQRTIEFAEQYNTYLEKCKRGIRASVVEMDAEQYYNETFNK